VQAARLPRSGFLLGAARTGAACSGVTDHRDRNVRGIDAIKLSSDSGTTCAQ
jgi:hypothetical protein